MTPPIDLQNDAAHLPCVNRILRIDALEGLRRLPDESVDLVVTDPPYNIAAADRTTMKNGKPLSTLKAWGHWDRMHTFDYDILILRLISECYRVLKPGGACYIYTAREQNGYFVRQAVARGFVYRNQISMIKKNPIPSFSKSNWRSAFELCMYLTKGKPKVFNFVSQTLCKNVFPYSNSHRDTTHPTEKPLDLIKLIIEVSSNEGDLVLDPFMGSGTTAVAAKQLGRRFLGFELDAEYVRMARDRLKGGRVRPHRRARAAA